MITCNLRGTTGKLKRAAIVFCLLCLAVLCAGSALAASSGNTVVVSGDSIAADHLAGGESQTAGGDAAANDNDITVVNSDGDFDVIGGYATVDNDGNATASGNSASVSGSNLQFGAVKGGYAIVGNDGDATANNNSVRFIDSVNEYPVWGGAASVGNDGNATASGNSLVFSDSTGMTRTDEIIGGYSTVGNNGTATANNNSVIISNSPNLIGWGGYVDGIGGESAVFGDGTATANSNSVSFSNSTVSLTSYNYLFGGEAYVSGSGAAIANSNSVDVNGSTVANGSVAGGYAETNNGSATANSNSVDVNGSTVVNGSVAGGYAGTNNGSATANDNSVSISGSTVTDVYGGVAYVYSNGAATASGNRVVVSGSTVGGSVYGGHASTANGTAKADNNYVEISDSVINGSVYGGYLDDDPDSTAINNTVTLRGNTTVNLGNNENIAGGLGSQAKDTFSGNTLNIIPSSAAGIAVNGAGSNDIENFGLYNFTFQAGAPDGAVGLAVGSNVTVYLSDGASTPSKISANIEGGGDLVQTNHTFKLFDLSGGGSVNGSGLLPSKIAINGKKGATLLYNYALDTATWEATVTGIQAHPQAKALSEGRASGTAFLNNGSDLIAESGMSNAWGRGAGFGSFTFGGASYGSSKIETGSHTDVEGFSVMGGIAKDFQKASGHLTLGAFLEGGWGSYDAYNDFANYASINSSGDTNYYGLGIAARYDAHGDEKGHFYGDGSVRFGKTETDFKSNLLDPAGTAARYDSDASYFGAHFGFGYLRNLNESSDLDLYTKLLWTRQGSDTVTISTGDPVEFDATDSVRWRTGLRYGRLARDNKFRWYIGAAYEHEFGGDADAVAYGSYAIDAPSLEGGTGIGEIGFTYKKSPDDPFSIDLNVSGYVGQREGVSGRLEMNWAF